MPVSEVTGQNNEQRTTLAGRSEYKLGPPNWYPTPHDVHVPHCPTL